MQKVNCWELMKCGREVAAPGRPVCPAVTATTLDGVNGGVAGGRCCWSVVGTFCADVGETCLGCRFFQRVSREEWPEVLVDHG